MPFVFLIVGLMLLVIGIRGQSKAAISLLQSEFTGSNSFIQWFIAIMVLGLAGYYKPVRPFTDGMMGLVILTMILNEQTQNNIFGAFENALQNTQPTPSPLSSSATNSTSLGSAVQSAITPPTLNTNQAPTNSTDLNNALSQYQAMFPQL